MKEKVERKKLGEICNLIKGKKPQIFVSKSNNPYLTARVVRKTELPKFAAVNCPVSVWVKSEDIIIIMDGSNSGEMFTGLKGALASTMGIVKYQKELINSKYLLHFLITHRDNFTKSRTGAAIPHLNKEEFENLEIPLPSLPEQKKIAAVLDEAFAAITKAKDNAEQNLKNSKELFESYLQSVFENKGEGWVNTTIGQTCNLQTGGTPSTSKKEYYQNGTIKWLVSGDINQGVINDCEGRITELGMNNSNTRYLPVNSVLIALNGQGKTRGTVAMLRTKATCNQSLVSIFPKDEKLLLPELVFSNLEGRYWEIRKMTGDSGNDRRGLNMPLIRSIKFSYPKKINEQKGVIKKLNALRSETKKLESVYKKKIFSLAELKKSILQKAFNGEF